MDYTLSDLFYSGPITKEEISQFITHLTVHENKIAVRSTEAARSIQQKFDTLNNDYFRKPEHIYANIKLSEVIKLALEEGYISESHLLEDDICA